MKIMQVLGNQHLFLYKERIIPDYANAITVQMLNDEGEWEDYYNEEEGMDWDEFEDEYLRNDPQFQEVDV